MILLEKHIFELENELLKSETRRSAKRISELLSENFMEFCSSGSVYNYKKGDVFENSDSSKEINWEIKEFKINQLEEDIVLATYKLIKHDDEREGMKYSLRSSVWKCLNGAWKMVFHQGTIVKHV